MPLATYNARPVSTPAIASRPKFLLWILLGFLSILAILIARITTQPISAHAASQGDPAISIIRPSSNETVRETPCVVQWAIKNITSQQIQFVELSYRDKVVKTIHGDEIEEVSTLSLTPIEGSHPMSIRIGLKSGAELSISRMINYFPDLPQGMKRIIRDTFQMGSKPDDPAAYDDEKPLHRVKISTYLIDQYEVTNKEYEKCVEAGACKPSRYANHEKWKGANKPVVGVTWEDAAAYCEFNDSRLPTEAEWERAARGGLDISQPVHAIDDAWLYENSGHKTHAVGSKNPNPYGLFDMVGNVWEWCADYYSAKYYEDSPEQNPTGAKEKGTRVLRGGGYGTRYIDARFALRHSWKPQIGANNIGFRCARDSY